MPGKHLITERAQALAAIPATEVRRKCESFCRPLLVEVTDRKRVWRCEICLRYIEAIISVQHEFQWTKNPKPREPLPDQTTIYDVLTPNES